MLVGYILFGGSIFLTKATRWIKSQESDIIHAIDGKLILGKCLPKDWRSIRSEHGGKGRSEIKVINSLSQSRVIFCWIGFDGTLYHFRTINDCSIKDGSVPNSIVEYATIYHAFVCYHSSIESGNILKLDQLDPTTILFILKPAEELRYIINITDVGIYLDTKNIEVPVPLSDSLSKEYICRIISGFSVFLEKDILLDKNHAIEILKMDLEAVSRLLPPQPLELLRKLTPIFVNCSIVYGTVASPVEGRHMCYHPDGGSVWLQSNGLNPSKSGSVEINCLNDYLQSRDLWGVGGLLLHELCHAFHDKHTPGGYNCSIIRQAYERAMSARLYDSVSVHGKQGEHGPVKSYACANAMEFWAELSVAYHCKDPNIEFNKWYPHNATQLETHDPHSFQVLQHVWLNDDIPCNSNRLAIEHI